MKAVPYARVSDPRQVANLSIPTQLKAIAAWAEAQGYELSPAFVDSGESAKTTDRAELQRLLLYCEKHRRQIACVVVYSISRFSRETLDYLLLRAHLDKLGIQLRSVTEPIVEGHLGEFIETLLAAVAQLDNRMKRERTIAGMKEALSRGRWPHRAPLGYLNWRSEDGERKTLIHDPERGPLVRFGFEELAGGGLRVYQVLREVTRRGLRTRRGRKVSPQTWDRMVKSPIYAGRLRVPSWGIDVPAGFEPLVSPETFEAAQQAIAGRRYQEILIRTVERPDFPLKGFARCASCETALTASWSRGNGGRYAYYRCWRCGGVKLRKERLEEAFVGRLDRMRAPREVLEDLEVVAREVSEERRKSSGAGEKATRARLARLRARRTRLEDYFLDGEIPRERYLEMRARVEQDIQEAEAALGQETAAEPDFSALFSRAQLILADPGGLWQRMSYRLRREFQDLLFEEGVRVDGLGTVTAPTRPLIFRLLAGDDGEESRMVSLSGASWNLLADWLGRASALAARLGNQR